jgi:hypothetical protein
MTLSKSLTSITLSSLGMQRLAAEHSQEAFNVLLDLMHRSPNQAVRLAAASEVLARAHGRPKNTHVVEAPAQDDAQARELAHTIVRLHPELAEALFSGQPLSDALKALPSAPREIE